MPRRRDIDPLQLRGLLPNLQLLDAGAEPNDLRYRLTGEVIVGAFGFDPRGMTRGEIRTLHVLPARLAEFDRTSQETHNVAARDLVSYSHDYMTSYRKDYLAYARLLLPVSEDGWNASGVFGAIFLANAHDAFWRDFDELHVEVPLSKL